jgi:hypothetical protein
VTARIAWWPGDPAHAPLSGSYDHGDYGGARWVPTPGWSNSAYESNRERIEAIRALLPSLPSPQRGWIESALGHLDRMYRWLASERARGIPSAERAIARGELPPRRPKRLRLAREAERRAWSTLISKIEQFVR